MSNQDLDIIRTERGLTISGSRISLYDVMDLLRADYPPKLIRDRFNLTDAEINVALAYIADHPVEVEAEYQEVRATREEIYQYWQDKNREHFDRIATKPRTASQLELLARLEQQKKERGLVWA
ncbi:MULTISPECIES: DUF433 domain-containing protein [Planktothrix]|jgi:uncharacterized protein (DUF433 family)|uniref:DUF433 domain-containing protein n=1 Tax=Planktothrix TaxID=54304 RepID=UPI000408D69A|nr:MULTISPECIES: DUF433 domain-containing protein [Planktothrix]